MEVRPALTKVQAGFASSTLHLPQELKRNGGVIAPELPVEFVQLVKKPVAPSTRGGLPSAIIDYKTSVRKGWKAGVGI